MSSTVSWSDEAKSVPKGNFLSLVLYNGDYTIPPNRIPISRARSTYIPRLRSFGFFWATLNLNSFKPYSPTVSIQNPFEVFRILWTPQRIADRGALHKFLPTTIHTNQVFLPCNVLLDLVIFQHTTLKPFSI